MGGEGWQEPLLAEENNVLQDRNCNYSTVAEHLPLWECQQQETLMIVAARPYTRQSRRRPYPGSLWGRDALGAQPVPVSNLC